MQVSFTQLMTYVRCPEHWLFRYKLGIKHPPRKAFKHGFALHETFAYHFNQKKEDGKGLKPQYLKEFFAEVFENALEDYALEIEDTKKLLLKEYLQKEKEINTKVLLDLGMKGIEVYYRELNPKIHPDLVETAFSFPAGRGVVVLGRIDLTDKKGVIHEMKTTRRTPNMQDIRNDPQLAIYQIGFQQLKKKVPAGISKDYIVFSKKEPKIIRFQVTRPFLNKDIVLRHVNTIMEAVQRNIFYCLHPTESWVCSKEWCGYFRLHSELRKIGLPKFIAKYTNNKNSRS